MPDILSVPDEGLGNSSYIIDLGDGRLAVVDPVRHPGHYLRHADRAGAEIAFAIETHLHADFISGSRELSVHGAKVIASRSSGLAFPHHPLAPGAELDLGGLTLRAIPTPGHTPEHLSYLLLDGKREMALFSGGALVPGSVARTDLIGPDQTEALARSLYRSLSKELLLLPDDLVVYPTHGTGASFCSAGNGTRKSSTTIGEERRTNPLLAVSSEDEFVQQLLSSYGTYPRYFLRLRDVNAKGPRLYGEGLPALRPLEPAQVADVARDGAEVIDVRRIDAFSAGHIPGALSNELRPAFATWLGSLVDLDTPLVFVMDEDQDESILVAEALKIGYENLLGRLEGGMNAWRRAGYEQKAIELVAPESLPGSDRTVVDVRQTSEFASHHVDGAIHRELGSLADRSGTLANTKVVLMCGHGERAMTGASLLERAGHGDVAVLRGGPDDIPGS